MNFQFACGLFEMKSENVISFQNDHMQIWNSFWNHIYFEKKCVNWLTHFFFKMSLVSTWISNLLVVFLKWNLKLFNPHVVKLNLGLKWIWSSAPIGKSHWRRPTHSASSPSTTETLLRGRTGAGGGSQVWGFRGKKTSSWPQGAGGSKSGPKRPIESWETAPGAEEPRGKFLDLGAFAAFHSDLGVAVSLGRPCGYNKATGAMEVATNASCCEFWHRKIKFEFWGNTGII